MPELWARAPDATNRKLREMFAADQSAANRKLKELWARDNAAVNRKIFSGALEWTTQMTPIPPDKTHWPDTDAVGNSSRYSAYIHTPYSHSVDDWGCYVEYKFSQALLMREGQRLYIGGNATTMAENPFWAVCVNSLSNTVWVYNAPADKSFMDEYYFPTDIQISSITVEVGCTLSMAGYPIQIDCSVTVNSSDYGTFLLDNSGTSG